MEAGTHLHLSKLYDLVVYYLNSICHIDYELDCQLCIAVNYAQIRLHVINVCSSRSHHNKSCTVLC